MKHEQVIQISSAGSKTKQTKKKISQLRPSDVTNNGKHLHKNKVLISDKRPYKRFMFGIKTLGITLTEHKLYVRHASLL